MISFCIPTWNRVSSLKHAVGSIAAQIRATGLPARICVSDNGSSDETWRFLTAAREENSFIEIHRFPENRGFEENFKKVLLMGQTEWCWTFGDDDLLSEGALLKAWDFLEREPVSFVHCCQ